jgi:hypothetical protein
MRHRPYKYITFERNASMRQTYVKITCLLIISFLALFGAGCGESGSPGGGGIGKTASIQLDLEKNELPADGSSSTAVTIQLLDSSGNAVYSGTPVQLSTTIGKFTNGGSSYRVKTPDDSGIVKVSLISEYKTGEAVVKASDNGVTQSAKITFIEGAIPIPAFVSLGASTNSVKSDNSDSTEITAVVLDEARGPVKGITVSFSTVAEDGTMGAGQLSASSMVTDENGEVVVNFSSGIGDKRNQAVTIMATVDGLASRQIPIQVSGTTVTLEVEGSTNLEIGQKSSDLNIIVKDASEIPVYDAPVTFSLDPTSTGAVTIEPASGRTDINGEMRVKVNAAQSGTAVVKAESLGAMALQTYSVVDPARAFRIIEPENDLVAINTGGEMTVRVRSPLFNRVTFAASIGAWDGSNSQIIEKPVVNGEATAVFNAVTSGTSTIQVYPAEDPTISDTMRAAISAPSSEASRIRIQPFTTVIPLSTDQVKNSVVVEARVTNNQDQVVGGAPVLFSIINPTGGGEFLSPVVVYSDEFGTAKSTFTSGALPSGAQGVTIRAEIVNTSIFDNVAIIISGKAASVTIGRSTSIESINEDTSYKLPMSVYVTDANGSPVSGATVSLNLWPSHYSAGSWVGTEDCAPFYIGTRENEDVNRNLIMDPGEDINLDGQLTPPLSAAGAAPGTVRTDENGVANFELEYLKLSAAWIQTEIKASTVVSGTETTTTYRFRLPWLTDDAADCLLPHSPYFFEDEETEFHVGFISLTSERASIPADGVSSASIQATVFDSAGSPVPSGTPVTFTTNFGTFADGETSVVRAIPDNSGSVRVTLTSAAMGGVAQVIAKCQGVTQAVNILFDDGTANVGQIVLTATPDEIPADGASSTTIRATVFDASGNPVVGKPVVFTTDLGTFPNGKTSIAMNIANPQGFVDTSLRAGMVTGPATVMVTCGNVSQSIIIPFIASGPAKVLVEVIPDIVNPGGEAIIQATVTDANDNPIAGEQLNFTVTQNQSGGALDAPTGISDANGQVRIRYTAGPNAGSTTTCSCDITDIFQVKVNSKQTIYGMGELCICNNIVGAISLTVDPVSIGTGESATVTAIVYDTAGMPVPPGTVVTISTPNPPGLGLFPGAVSSIKLKTTTGTGTVVTTFMAGSTPGMATITAASGGVTQSANLEITSATGPGASLIGSLTLTPVNDEIIANGTSTTAVRARVLDIDGDPVSGEIVTFNASYGTLNGTVLSSTTAVTGSTGIAEVILTSANRTGVSVLLASIVDGFSDDAVVNFVPGPPVDANSSITVQPSNIPADGASTAEVTVTLADANGNPLLDGTSIALYSSRGAIITDNPAPTVSGRAMFTIQAPATTGTATIYLWDYPDITPALLGFGAITSGDPASILIQSVSHTEIAVTGVGINDNSAITVRVVDETGTTVVNSDISLWVELLAKPDGGEFISGEAPGGGLVSDTDEIEIGAATGEATFNLRSGVLPGVVEIRITVYESGTVYTTFLETEVVTVAPQISIASGPPHTMALSAPSMNAVVDLNRGADAGIPLTPGFYSRRAGLVVTDRYGNAVPDGTVLNLGVLDSVIATGTTGSTTSGNAVLTDAGAVFSTANVLRGGLVRSIEPNDRVVLFDRPAADKSRFVTIPIGLTTLPVTKDYTSNGGGIEYAVGASLIGGAIYGTDGTTATKGTVQTDSGLAQLRLVYPANRHTIHVGGYDTGIDTRYAPLNSARVISVFTSSDENVSMVDEGTLIFSSIAPWNLTAIPDEISGDEDIDLTLRDGGDNIRLPFIEITYSVKIDEGSAPTVTVGSTDVDGEFTSSISGLVAGDTGTVIYYAGDAKAEVAYEVPGP